MKAFVRARRVANLQRECLPLRDMTDCLLQAYDCVARRAYHKFVGRGGQPGGELDDWLNAERELLGNLPVNLQDGGDSLSVLASLPGLSSREVDIGIDPRWLVILGHHRAKDESANQEELDTDFDQVAAWVNTIHRDARTLRINFRDARLSGSPRARRVLPILPPQLGPASELVAIDADVNADVNANAELDCAESQLNANIKGAAKASQLFCVLELPSEIDQSRCVAVLADGLLGIRMPKRRSSAH
jgi:HSP20 family molecular chaperone IbpA